MEAKRDSAPGLKSQCRAGRLTSRAAAQRWAAEIFPDVLLGLVPKLPEERREAEEQLCSTLAALREQLGGSGAVAAELVRGGSPRVRHLFRWCRRTPEVRILFRPHPESPSAPPVDVARALVRRHGPGPAGIMLARQYGLGVFDALNRHARDSEVRALLGLYPRRAPGRPKGRTSRDLEAYALAELLDHFHVPRAALLRALGRSPKRTSEMDETADRKWLRRYHRRGRALRDGVPSPDAPIIRFYVAYLRGRSPEERLASLARLLPAPRHPRNQ